MSPDLQLNKCCHICEKIATYYWELQDKSLNPSGVDFHNINELVQSAKKGCHVCNLIFAELSESQIRDMQRELEDNPQHGTRQLRIGPYKRRHRDVALSHNSPDGGGLEIVRISIEDLHGR